MFGNLRSGSAALLAVMAGVFVVDGSPARAAVGPYRDADTVVFAASAGANGNWLDTGFIWAGPKTTGKITASGTAYYAPGGPVGPAGVPGSRCGNYATASDPCPDNAAPLGALIGRFGANGMPFVIGTGGTVEGGGELYLAFNDVEGEFGDNSGSYHVLVDYYQPAG